MLELLRTSPVVTITGFFITLMAIKECLQLYDFFNHRIHSQCATAQLNENDRESLKELTEKIANIELQIAALIDSDRDQLKGQIVKEYHYFTESRHWIDDYSLDCVERLNKHYIAEGGNTYIADLVAELRTLPKHPPKED